MSHSHHYNKYTGTRTYVRMHAHHAHTDTTHAHTLKHTNTQKDIHFHVHALSLSLSLAHAHTHKCTHTHSHTRTHAHHIYIHITHTTHTHLHARTQMKSIPKILDGYVGPNKIDPKISESCMLAVNSVNSCAFCTSLHGELGRMAGLENKGASINTAKDAAALKKVSSDPMVLYARKFGECNGRGADLKKAFDVMEKAVGPGKAAACEAQCWFLHWGSTCGNTLLSFFKGRLVGNSKCGSNPLFELVFAM